MAADNLTLGEFLRQERERRGVALEQVASATKIGVKTLHLLESDNYSELPAKPFIRGFVASYARFIGMDPKEILTRFDDFISTKGQDRPNREGGHSGYAFEKRDGDHRSRMLLTAVMVGFLIIGGLIGLIVKPSLHHHRVSHIEKLRAARSGTAEEQSGPPMPPGGSPTPLASVVATVTATEAVAVNVKGTDPKKTDPKTPLPSAVPSSTPSPAPEPSPSAEPSPTPKPSPSPKASPSPEATPSVAPSATPSPAPDPLDSGKELKSSAIKQKLVVKALADIWVRYQCDQRPVHRFQLKQGRSLVLRGQESVVFQFSNPKSVTVNYNAQGSKPASSFANIATRQDTPTLYFPAELAEKITEPFPGGQGLPETSDPGSEVEETPSTPNP